MSTLLLLNGPNLNLLGSREPGLYGTRTLAEIEADLAKKARQLGHDLACLQSNHEGELIDRIHAAKGTTDFIVFNPGAFTHTSIALRDALIAVEIPFLEVHLSNVFKREAFRQHSYFSDIASGCIIGLGAIAYEIALDAAHQLLQNTGT